MVLDQTAKAAAFQALHRRHGAFVIPNPWDAGTARILAVLGYEALATTSVGLAFALGRPDSKRAVTRDVRLRRRGNVVCGRKRLHAPGILSRAKINAAESAGRRGPRAPELPRRG